MSDEQKDHPKTIDEAVDRLLEKLTGKELEEVRQADTVDLHFSLGGFIRNEFGLWDGSPLVTLGRMPDDVSTEIIEALKRRLDSTEK